MQMTLTTRGGETVYLPPSITLDDNDQALNVPGAVIPGKHGRRPYGHLARLEPKTLRASGTVDEVTREQADHLAMTLRSQLLGKGPLRIRRDAGDDRWIEARCTSVSHNPHRGHFHGRLASFRMVFQADDPFWYHAALTEVAEEVSGFSLPSHTIDTENIGDVEVDPIIWITGRTVNGQHTVNPSLYNYRTGRMLRYDGELKEGEVLILDPGASDRMAIKIPDNVEHSGVAQGSTTDSIALAPTASDEDGAYTDRILRIVDGTGTGQIRRIVGYSGSTRVALVNDDWDIVPDVTSEYEVYRVPLDDAYWLYEAQWGAFAGGINAVNSLNADYIVNGFPLGPGMNRIEVRGDTEHMHVSVVYRARWI